MELSNVIHQRNSLFFHTVVLRSGAGDASYGHQTGIFSIARTNDGFAAAFLYGDSNASWAQGQHVQSTSTFHGTLAIAEQRNYSISWGHSQSETAQARQYGDLLNSVDPYTLNILNGIRAAAVRNGIEAFSIIGESRAYMDGRGGWAVHSNTGTAGITGNTLWVQDARYGSASASLRFCVQERMGICACQCHGVTRIH